MDGIPTWATDIAAQIWCQPENENTVMDINLCTSFARALVTERERAAGIALDNERYWPINNAAGEITRQAVAVAIRKGE